MESGVKVELVLRGECSTALDWISYTRSDQYVWGSYLYDTREGRGIPERTTDSSHDEIHVTTPLPAPRIVLPLWASSIYLQLFGVHEGPGRQPRPPWVVPTLSMEHKPCSSASGLKWSWWDSDVRAQAILHYYPGQVSLKCLILLISDLLITALITESTAWSFIPPWFIISFQWDSAFFISIFFFF